MSDGRLKKVEVDCSEIVKEKVPEFTALGKQSGRLGEAIEKLLNLEKQCRQGEDELSAHKVCVAIVELCFAVNDLKALNENIILLSKRRGQFPQAVVKVVRAAMAFLDDPKMSKAQVLELLETLRLVTAGKIFVEVERARLTLRLAKIKEADGDVADACTTLQDIQVETLGAMDKREKTEFILEQMRMCLENKDFIRCNIISKKISEKALLSDDFQDLKLRFYKHMIRFHSESKDYLSICRAYQSIYNTENVRNDVDHMNRVLKNLCIFVCLSPHGPMQQDIMVRTSKDKNLEKLPVCTALLKCFITPEIVSWTAFDKNFGDLQKDRAFEGDHQGRWEDMRKRVTEHNIRTVEKYYSKLRMERLAFLLDLTVEEAESCVSEMVVSKSVYAKIDRPAGVVSFERPKPPSDVLNTWADNISSLLKHVEKCTHDIQKENMMYNIAGAAST